MSQERSFLEFWENRKKRWAQMEGKTVDIGVKTQIRKELKLGNPNLSEAELDRLTEEEYRKA